MAAPTKAPKKREALSIRIKSEELDLIDRVAKMRGKNLSDIMLEASRLAAEEALLTKRYSTSVR